MVNPIAATSAYANIARLTTAASDADPVSGGAGGGGNFASVLKQAMGAVDAMGRRSDAQAQALAAGKANMVDVVTAVSETEVAIDAVVAVRDRVIAAYEDIMKMPI
jgi:flagellar hook-basal body complex protein FliE